MKKPLGAGLLTALLLLQLTGCSKKEDDSSSSDTTKSAPSASTPSVKPGGAKPMQAPGLEMNSGTKEPAFGTKSTK